MRNEGLQTSVLCNCIHSDIMHCTWQVLPNGLVHFPATPGLPRCVMTSGTAQPALSLQLPLIVDRMTHPTPITADKPCLISLTDVKNLTDPKQGDILQEVKRPCHSRFHAADSFPCNTASGKKSQNFTNCHTGTDPVQHTAAASGKK